MLEDDSVTVNKTGAFAKVTSIESEIGITHLNSHPREKSKSLGCLDTPTIPEPPTERLN